MIRRRENSDGVGGRVAGRGLLSVAGVASFWLGIIVATAVGARVKFDAPSLTVPVGLDVGRHVFAAIGVLELALWGVTCILGVIERRSRVVFSIIGATGVGLALQAIWLRPALNARAAAIIEGAVLESSSLHLNYIGVEVVKVLALVALTFLAAPTDDRRNKRIPIEVSPR